MQDDIEDISKLDLYQPQVAAVFFNLSPSMCSSPVQKTSFFLSAEPIRSPRQGEAVQDVREDTGNIDSPQVAAVIKGHSRSICPIATFRLQLYLQFDTNQIFV